MKNSPKIIKTSDINLYGKPASGNAITDKLIPIVAKNVMTQLVHPYVKIPNKIDRNPKLLAGLSLPLITTSAVLKFIISVDSRAIMIFSVILITTK